MDITDFHKNDFIIIDDDFIYGNHDIAAEMDSTIVASLHHSQHCLQELRSHLLQNGINNDILVILYQSILDNNMVRQGMRLVPSAEGLERIIDLYDEIESCRSIIMQVNETGPFRSEDDSLLYWVAYGIIKMYDDYCAGIRELIVPPTTQQSTIASPSGNVDSVTKTSESNVTTKTDKGNRKKKEVFHIDNIDVDVLSDYFNKEFKGIGGHLDRFSRLVGDIKQLTLQKEMGMLAVMIRRSPYHKKKHKTFAGWFRAFCKIVGQPHPKDLHPNKYSPSEQIRARFYYLHYDDKVNKE